MDDLISRKALYDAMEKREEMYAKGNCLYDAYNYHVSAEIVANVPSVPAVPLDKLCEWLTANRVSIPCRLCEYDDAGECTVQNDMSKPCPNTTRDWRMVITKWMEGLDDHG